MNASSKFYLLTCRCCTARRSFAINSWNGALCRSRYFSTFMKFAPLPNCSYWLCIRALLQLSSPQWHAQFQATGSLKIAADSYTSRATASDNAHPRVSFYVRHPTSVSTPTSRGPYYSIDQFTCSLVFASSEAVRLYRKDACRTHILILLVDKCRCWIV